MSFLSTANLALNSTLLASSMSTSYMTGALEPTHLEAVQQPQSVTWCSAHNGDAFGPLIAAQETRLVRRDRVKSVGLSIFVHGSLAAGVLARVVAPDLDPSILLPLALPYALSALVYMKDRLVLHSGQGHDQALDTLRYTFMVLRGQADVKMEQSSAQIEQLIEAVESRIESGDESEDDSMFEESGELGKLNGELSAVVKQAQTLLRHNLIQGLLRNPLTPLLRWFTENTTIGIARLLGSDVNPLHAFPAVLFHPDVAEFLIDQGVIDPEKFRDPTYTLERELIGHRAYLAALAEIMNPNASSKPNPRE